MEDQKIRAILQRDLPNYELADEDAGETVLEALDTPQVDSRAGSLEAWQRPAPGKRKTTRSTSELLQVFAKRKL